MSSRGVLVIHAAEQDEDEPLAAHQEQHECGCGWWDYTWRKFDHEPLRQPVGLLADEDLRYGVLCLPDGQLFFQPEHWPLDFWKGLLRGILTQYPDHVATIIWCHS